MLASTLVFLSAASVSGRAQEPDQVTAADLANAQPTFRSSTVKSKTMAAMARLRFGVPGIDSLVNFSGSYSTFGFDSMGNPNNKWFYNMVGNPPEQGETTVIKSPIIPVSVLMLDIDGTPRYVNGQLLYADATQYVPKLLRSPIFENFRYTSSRKPTQFTDAVQRAEFWRRLRNTDSDWDDRDDWHTLLAPQVKTPRVMLLPSGSYRFALNADGSCCSFILVDENTFFNLLFPPAFPFDGMTTIGAAELAGDITTKDISTFLFPNTYLYQKHDPANCCVLGFHTFDSEPGVPENGNIPRRYVVNFSSWISPGIFRGSVQDITATSHEIAEIYNDPFVAADGVLNITPWWLAPNGNCQNDLETGDVIENLANGTFPIELHGFTYHPQNEALLQWFEFKSPSNAIQGAYSYPDTNVLTALSDIEKPGCK